MKHLIAILACILPLHTSISGMERQALLAKQGQTAATTLSTFQQVPVLYQHNSQPAEVLVDLTKKRNPDEKSFLMQEKRTENLALIKSIGVHNTTSKLALLTALIFALNGAKDIISSGYWGKTTIFPTTDLIPPSHLMNLQPCYQICNSYCDPMLNNCLPDCTGQWDCSRDTTTLLSTLGTACVSSFAVNGAGLITSFLIALRSCQKEEGIQKKLDVILNDLYKLTDGSSEESKKNTPLVNPVQEVVNTQSIPYSTSTEQKPLDRKHIELIAQIQTTGSLEAKWKMCAVLTAIFGANLAKDATLGFLWGIDTTYPLTPLIHNFSSPLTPCQQVCWQSGCCFGDCENYSPCITSCGVDCVNIQSSPNAFGYTSFATLLANFTGMMTSGFLAARYYTQHKKADTAIEEELSKLDSLIASDANKIN